MTRDLIIDRLKNRAQLHSQEDAYFYKAQDQWKSISWQEYYHLCRRIAKSLLSIKLTNNSKITLLSYNSPQWTASGIAAQLFGGVSVGIYSTSVSADVKYIVEHSDSEILFIENKERYFNQVKPIKDSLNKVKLFVILNNDDINEERVISFKNFLSLGNSLPDRDLDAMFSEVNPCSTCTIIYTSGTTGKPKAVMLSHNNVAWTVRTATNMWRCGTYDRIISYLPLAHVAEQMFSAYAGIDCGMKTYFATSFDGLKTELAEVEPTIFFGVPRVFEKIYYPMKQKLSQQSKSKKMLIKYFMNINNNFYKITNQGKEANFLLKLSHNIGKKLIFNKIKKLLGFTKTRAILTGAAPISKDILEFFFSLDVPIYELYGLSETTGPVCINTVGATKIGSVGHALPKTKVKIAEDGEILTQGPNVFSGYYKDDNTTLEALKDGWFHTGDIGNIDNQGYIFINDRKKDLLITAGGKNISPQNLEFMLRDLPYVQSAVVVGDRKKYLCALLAPNKELLSKKAIETGENFNKILHNKNIHEEIQKELTILNEKLSPFEQIKKYFLLNNEFSIDTGEYTPTLKLKRKFINEKYKNEIEKLYQ